jgi:hypothetical protein
VHGQDLPVEVVHEQEPRERLAVLVEAEVGEQLAVRDRARPEEADERRAPVALGV